MMSWATKQKITYVSILFSAFLIVFMLLFPFLFRKQPTCFDNRENQGEFGVDCGGPCSLLCKSDTLASVVLWQRFFRISDGVYSALAYVQNPNLNSAAYDVSYTFRLYDSRNILILERTGTATIAPIITTPIFESALLTGERVPARVTFAFNEKPNWFRVGSIPPKIVLSDQNIDQEANAPFLSLLLTNTTLKNIPRFDVVAVLFDADGTAIGASKTVIDSLSPEKRVSAVFSWREPFPARVAKIDIIPKLFPGIHY